MGDTVHPDDILRRLALGLESLRPATSPPAWAETTGPLDDPTAVVWHDGLETIFGFVAPAGCHAVAVVANGWGRGLETGPPASVSVLEPGERRRIRVVCLVARDGRIAGHLRAGTELLVDHPPETGRVLDCLLRCFQLATVPPEETTDRLLAAMWLTNVEPRARLRPGRLSWAETVGLHPAMQVLEMAGEAIPLDQVHVALRAASKAWGWDCLLDQARSDGPLAATVPPALARWMDQGMFSRWVMNSWPGPETLLLHLTDLLAPGVARRLRRTLDSLGVAATPAMPAQPSTR